MRKRLTFIYLEGAQTIIWGVRCSTHTFFNITNNHPLWQRMKFSNRIRAINEWAQSISDLRIEFVTFCRVGEVHVYNLSRPKCCKKFDIKIDPDLDQVEVTFSYKKDQKMISGTHETVIFYSQNATVRRGLILLYAVWTMKWCWC